MAPIMYEIDPNADTVITLKNAVYIFAPWDAEASTTLTQRVTSVPLDNPIRTPHLEVAEGRSSFLKETTTEGSATLSTPASTIESDTSDEYIHFRVSSRHLMLASPWIRRALTKDAWSESNRHDIDGLFHITAEDWDEDSFLILLNILHLRNRQVPRTVTLEMLAKIAVLVDYYECGEAIELFTDMWITSLKKGTKIPSVYNRDLVLWIWISWVFNLSDCFERATAVAIKQSDEGIRSLDLPLPTKVIDEIDGKRNQAIESIVGQVHGLLDNYRSSSYQCPQDNKWSFQCGCSLLGVLTKEMNRMALLSPRPEVPFTKLSFNGLCYMLRSTQSPRWLEYVSDDYRDHSNHACNPKETVTSIVKQVSTCVTGLNLEETKKVNPNLDV